MQFVHLHSLLNFFTIKGIGKRFKPRERGRPVARSGLLVALALALMLHSLPLVFSCASQVREAPCNPRAETMTMPRFAEVLLLLLSLLALPGLAFGEAAISGAFGYTLGEALHPQPTERTVEGYPIFRFTPEGEERLFAKAQLRLTPDTGKIFDISAVALFPAKEAAEAALSRLKKTLESRHGKATSRTVGHGVLYSITRKDRRLLFFAREATGADGWLLYVNYADIELYRKARQALFKRVPPAEALGMRPRRR